MHPNRIRLTTVLLLAGACTLAQAQAARPDAEQMRAYADRLLDEERLPADGPGVAVLVARGDQLLYRSARGMASIELGVPLNADQLFRIGSVTKQFAAVTLLQLIDAGKARLDDPLSKYLPDYPKGDTVTLQQLLNHTSGIQSYTGIPGYMDNPVRRQLGTRELVAEFKDLPTNFAPGQRFLYNNSGYVLVGAVIEAITGKPWHQQLHEALLAPLKLTHTAYPGDTRLLVGMVRGYGHDVQQGVVDGGLISMTQPHAAGALVSSVDDLWRWNLALHSGRLLSPALYARMVQPEGAAATAGYGYGIGASRLRGETVLRHGGGIHGFVSSLAYLPDSQVSVVLLRNTTGPGFNLETVASKLAAFAIGKPYPAVQPVAVPLEQLLPLQGLYTTDGRQTRSLIVRDGQLVSTRSGGASLTLIPLGGDAFVFPGSLTRMQVQRDADGRGVAVQMFRDGEGEAETWARYADLPERAGITLSPEQRAALVGDYASAELQVKIFSNERGQLMGQMPGQPAIELQAESPARLYTLTADARLEFEFDEGRATQATFRQGRFRTVMKRR